MSKFCITFSWDETPHLDVKARADLMSTYLPHELSARTRGVPSLGAGAIYPVPEEDIVCDPIEFPLWYRHVYGLDVGWNRTACVWAAIDPETHMVYLYDEHYRGAAEPPIHAEAIKARGRWIPGVVDPAARGRKQDDGKRLMEMYQALGLNLVTADNSVYSGLQEVWSRMSTGRLKVFSTMQNWLREFRLYRRNEKGDIIKENDHLMDAMRYLCISGIDIAAQRPADQWMGRTVNGLAVGKPKHEYEYAPMASAWSPQTGSAEAVKNRGQSPWMPHKVG